MTWRRPQARCRLRAFTLVELLVVIAIIGVLVALLLPAIQAAREAARRTQCQNNLKQLGIALQTYHDAHNRLPPARWNGGVNSWFALMMPFMEAQNQYNMWDLDRAYRDPVNKPAREAVIPGFACPSRRPAGGLSIEIDPGDPPGAVGDYAGNLGDDLTEQSDGDLDGDLDTHGTILQPDNFAFNAKPYDSGISFKHVSDGLSNTFFVGEKHVVERYFYYPYSDASIYNANFLQPFARLAGPQYPLTLGPSEYNSSASDGGWLFGSWHPGVCMFGVCDGSVRTLATSVDLEMYGRFANRADGESLDLSRLGP